MSLHRWPRPSGMSLRSDGARTEHRGRRMGRPWQRVKDWLGSRYIGGGHPMVDLVERLLAMTNSVGEAVLRPDPEPEQIVHPIISVDDHAVEPPDTFSGRL